MVTRGYKGLQRVKVGHKKLKRVTKVTRGKTGYWRLLGVTGGF